MDPIPAVLDAERRARGLSVVRLAKDAGVSLSVAQRTLAGESSPRIDTLLTILRALGRDLGWLHRQGVRPI